ncbi:DUF2891 domain-containing protein [Fretibacter rubidus]|uniref:DUF2891 domain-containing protein n=1 Tax=Fretibacter rubidus TaxID=570162 RepID=UPI00352A9665
MSMLNMKNTLLPSILLTGALALSACGPVDPDMTTATRSVDDMAMSQQTGAALSYPGDIDAALADRFAALAVNCVDQEFPNKISRTTDTAEEIGRPKVIFPVFYGCFDWHSAVHGHWLLVRLLRDAPEDTIWREEALAKLDANFTQSNIDSEIANFARPARGSWERPYGLAWFLQLTAELREVSASDSSLAPQAKIWLDRLMPLERDIADSLNEWLPKLAYPIRLGTHNQSAFAFGLMLDWARAAGDTKMERLIIEKSLAFHKDDVNCPLDYEPSGEDFLSPCLMTADLMRRILSPSDFDVWFTAYMPAVPTDGSGDWLAPGIVNDITDGKLVHLDGVNSSRAWNLYNIARALPDGDPRKASLVAAAKIHADTGVAAVSDEHYAGSHWLASFATYLMTDRGWQE